MAAVHIEPELEIAYRNGHVLEVEPHLIHFNTSAHQQITPPDQSLFLNKTTDVSSTTSTTILSTELATNSSWYYGDCLNRDCLQPTASLHFNEELAEDGDLLQSLYYEDSEYPGEDHVASVHASSLPAFAVLAAMAATGIIILALAAFIRQLRAKDLIQQQGSSPSGPDPETGASVIGPSDERSVTTIVKPKEVRNGVEIFDLVQPPSQEVQDSLNMLPDITGRQIPGVEEYFPRRHLTVKDKVRQGFNNITVIFRKKETNIDDIPKDHLQSIYVY